MTIRIVNSQPSKRLNRYFETKEFKCKGRECGCAISILDPTLLRKLTTLRELIGKPLVINSGYRCPDHNSLSGGQERSFHLSGQAADIALPGAKNSKAASHMLHYAKILFPFHYLGDGFVHVDIRELS